MGGSPSKRPEKERKWEEEKREQKRSEAIDRLRQAIYGGSARLPAEVQSISKQREEERKRKEERRQHERDEAAHRLRHAIYGEYAKLPAEVELDDEIESKEENKQREVQNDAVDRLRQAIYGEYPGLPAHIQILIEQQKRQLELERVQHEQMLAFQQLMTSKRESQERKVAENAFLGRLKKHKVARNLDLLNDFRMACSLTPLSSYPTAPYTEKDLLKTSEDYRRASAAFKTKNRLFTISKITRVDNTFHVLQYKLMKDKYRTFYDELFLTEILMFHGTKREFLDSICTYNFDRTKVRKHKFGHGISFARQSLYASHYPRDNKRNCHKVMVIAQVFFRVGVERSTANMIVPRGCCYTSANDDGTVLVKYDDASFYPLYIVYYEGLHPRYMNRRAR